MAGHSWWETTSVLFLKAGGCGEATNGGLTCPVMPLSTQVRRVHGLPRAKDGCTVLPHDLEKP